MSLKNLFHHNDNFSCTIFTFDEQRPHKSSFKKKCNKSPNHPPRITFRRTLFQNPPPSVFMINVKPRTFLYSGFLPFISFAKYFPPTKRESFIHFKVDVWINEKKKKEAKTLDQKKKASERRKEKKVKWHDSQFPFYQYCFQ